MLSGTWMQQLSLFSWQQDRKQNNRDTTPGDVYNLELPILAHENLLHNMQFYLRPLAVKPLFVYTDNVKLITLKSIWVRVSLFN